MDVVYRYKCGCYRRVQYVYIYIYVYINICIHMDRTVYDTVYCIWDCKGLYVGLYERLVEYRRSFTQLVPHSPKFGG